MLNLYDIFENTHSESETDFSLEFEIFLGTHEKQYPGIKEKYNALKNYFEKTVKNCTNEALYKAINTKLNNLQREFDDSTFELLSDYAKQHPNDSMLKDIHFKIWNVPFAKWPQEKIKDFYMANRDSSLYDWSHIINKAAQKEDQEFYIILAKFMLSDVEHQDLVRECLANSPQPPMYYFTGVRLKKLDEETLASFHSKEKVFQKKLVY